MRKLVIVFAAVGAAVSAAVVVLYGLLRGGWLEGVLAGIAVGMSMLPEEFPMVLAVFMAMGAWRISKVRVLTRRASAIETLGAASVLCTDKTGTLTENRMTIAELRLPDGTAAKTGAALPESFRELAAAGVMASAPEPFDPMEKAFHVLSKADLRSGETLPGEGRKLVRSYPLSSALLAMSQAWEAGKGWQIAAKGPPEAVAVLCRLDQATRCHADGAGRSRWPARACACWGWPRHRSRAPCPRMPAISGFSFLALWAWSTPCAPRSPTLSPSAAVRASG